MTTLADLTPEERAQCRGMWVSYQTPVGEHQAIYEAGSTLFEPGYGRFKIPLEHITPRDDLPRAWTPDGQPPAGEWLNHGTHTRVIPRNRRAYVTKSEPTPREEA